MSDGQEEREEQDRRREWERKKDRDDRLDRYSEPDEWDRERQDSKAADAAVLAESGKRTRRSFVVAAAAAAAGYGFYRWIDQSPGDQWQRKPLRKTLDVNAALSKGVFGERGMAPEYPVHRSVELRTNGVYGLKAELVPESYRLQVVGVENAKSHSRYVDDVTAWEYRYTANAEDSGNHDTKVAPRAETKAETTQGDKRLRGREEAGLSDNTLKPGTPGLLLTIEDVTKLPHKELVTEFKCIEGWSQIVRWGGVGLADFMGAYPPAKKADGSVPQYVYMETPDGDYYCGFDRRTCEHPQSLLVTEMAGRPLNQWHGAPLRLHMPIKYGYKQIKRIGLIAYTDIKPDDYWTKLGYDWYAGL